MCNNFTLKSILTFSACEAEIKTSYGEITSIYSLLAFWPQRRSEKTSEKHQALHSSPHMLLFSASTGESLKERLKERKKETELSLHYKSSMALLSISHYLLTLLLTYYCILANVTVQADDITFQLTGRRNKKNELNNNSYMMMMRWHVLKIWCSPKT